ncbi:hypothetical protein LPJ64_002347 [Coemansia asiatica]|uniref:WD40 repeat-like protein n=1 Tax=Coemansia asiatica TaxID=1052880 RepID=A0A9W8CL23_9FUNG|nr:hypothetical protein LPJ64_002347 [Coemansia asiatica]
MAEDWLGPLDSITKDEAEVPAKRMRLDSDSAQTPLPTAEDVEITAEDINPKPEPKPLTQEHVFGNLRLRRIVRENHNSTVAQIALMYYRPSDQGLGGHGMGGMQPYERSFDKRGAAIRDPSDNSNLLVTTGQTQASVFDNENCGDHLDIMSHFQLKSESDTELPLQTCCWVRSNDDAIFAVAGGDHHVHIISLAWTREIRILQGHSGPVIDLQPHPTDSRLLLSVSKDKTMRIWSVVSGECLCVYSNEATAACFHPEGVFLVAGAASGDVRQWPVPDLSTEPSEPYRLVVSDSTLIVSGKRTAGSVIDCLRFAKGNLLVKNASGRIEYWDLEQQRLMRSFGIRNHGISASRFDVSYDDEYICAGNSRGEAYIYGIESGKTITRLAHKRSVKPVTCCLFSRDCRSVIYAGEGGFIWRYDYVDDETLAEWEKPDESVSEEESSIE